MALRACGQLAAAIFAMLIVTAFTESPVPAVSLTLSPIVELRSLSEAGIVRSANVGSEAYGPQLPRHILRATGYNSVPEQTNSQPFITATGARTRFGIIAVSRDLLAHEIPYGSLVRIKDLGYSRDGQGAGKFQEMLDAQGLFIVEDTMHQRKRGQIDVWFEHIDEARNWGVRQVEVEVIRYGRDGPMLEREVSILDATPVLVADMSLASRSPY